MSIARLAAVLALTVLVAATALLVVGPRGPAPVLARSTPRHVRPAVESADWPAYGRDPGGSRYAPLAQIDRGNVRSLRVAWTYRTGETDSAWATAEPTAMETTPIVVDGWMYLSTPLGRVIALDAERGTERWVYDPRVDRNGDFGDFTSRGVSFWEDSSAAAGAPCRRRIFLAPIDARLIALDARSGQPCAGFGAGGVVDLQRDLANPAAYHGEYEVTSPPVPIGGLVVVGSAVADGQRTDAPNGVVRAFDARTGALRWSWDPIPPRTGAANAWSIIAADPARDLVFIPTGSASPDYFGGERPGDNRYANSIVALRASTGRVVWHFQTVHHDLWDYDVASPPLLLTVMRDGREVPALAQATKVGHLFLLHRETGEPLSPVEERPVPASDVPGEQASPTQPFPAAFEPLVPQRLEPDDAWGLTPWDRGKCRDRIAALRHDGVFTPPSLRGTAVFPGNVGGAHWGGMALDPVAGLLVVPTNRLAMEVALIPRDVDLHSVRGWYPRSELAPQRGTPYAMRREAIISPLGLPCNRPPFGALAAIDLATGRKRWEVPLGTTRDFFAAKLGLPITWRLGMPNLGGPMVTAGGLVFIAASMDDYLRAFDVETGEELWKAHLPASAQATPMTYRTRADGRQYVVVAAGGHGKLGTTRGDYIVAYSLGGER